jgi:hypothetical protein
VDIVRRTVRGTDAGDGASGKSNTVVSLGGGQKIGGEQRKDKNTYGQSETSYCHWGGVWGHKSSPGIPFPRSPFGAPPTLLTTFCGSFRAITLLSESRQAFAARRPEFRHLLRKDCIGNT